MYRIAEEILNNMMSDLNDLRKRLLEIVAGIIDENSKKCEYFVNEYIEAEKGYMYFRDEDGLLQRFHKTH